MTALAERPIGDPHAGWLADRNRLYRIRNEHDPMSDALAGELTDFMADLEARIENTPATEPAGMLAKAIYGLQISAEGFEPNLEMVMAMLAEAKSVAAIGQGGAHLGGGAAA